MEEDIAGWLARYQAAIVGLIGFLGVVLTLYVNARSARQQELATKREEWARTLEDRAHRRRGMERALLAELRLYHHVITDGIEELRRRPHGDPAPVIVPNRRTDVFTSHLKHIGLLAPEVLDKVLPAFLALHESMRRISVLAPPGGTGEVFMVPPQHLVELVLIWKHTLDHVDAAIAVLEAALAPGRAAS